MKNNENTKMFSRFDAILKLRRRKRAGRQIFFAKIIKVIEKSIYQIKKRDSYIDHCFLSNISLHPFPSFLQFSLRLSLYYFFSIFLSIYIRIYIQRHSYICLSISIQSFVHFCLIQLPFPSLSIFSLYLFFLGLFLFHATSLSFLIYLLSLFILFACFSFIQPVSFLIYLSLY